MSEHDQIMKLLPQVGTGDVPPEEFRRIQKHLAGCDQCRRASEDYASLGRALRGLPTPQPSAELLARVRVMAAQRLAQNQASKREAVVLAPLVVASWIVALATWPLVRVAGMLVLTGWQWPGGSVTAALLTYSTLGFLLAGAAAIAVIRRAGAIGRAQ